MHAIPCRQIGRTDLFVPEIGFGAASLGNLYEPVTDADARATVDAALAAGMRYIDTAPHYGRGLSERRIGDAVRGQTGVVVSTKVGRLMRPDPSILDDQERDGFRSPMPFRMVYNYSYDGIMRSAEDSLQRLGLGKIDLLYIHDIGRYTHGEAADGYWQQLTGGGGLKALEQLRDAGTVTGIGLGVNEVQACLDVMRETRLDAILLAGRYTLLEQDAVDILFPTCLDAGTSIIVGGPYNSGILATGTRHKDPIHYDYGPAPEGVIARVRKIEDVADRHGVHLPAAALAFVLAHPVVASVIPGLGNPSRVTQTLNLYRANIPAAFWAELRSEGLIRSDVSVPSDNMENSLP
jgi:D-threo-aldose 1-dehydrogenase